MKKIISVLLTLAFICSMIGSAAATTVSETITLQSEANTLALQAEAILYRDLEDTLVSEATLEAVAQDLATLNDAIMPDDISITQMNRDGTFTYAVTMEGFETNYIKVDALSNGNIYLDITEGDKRDQFILMPDGRVFLDGSEVIFEVSEEIVPIADGSGMVTPFSAGFENYYSQVSTSTSLSSYTLKLTQSVANASCDKYIKDMTNAGLKLIIKVMLGQVGYGNIFAVLSTMYTTIANNLINLGKSYASSTMLSMKVMQYDHKDNNVIYRYIYKFQYYAQKDFLGTADTTYVYHEKYPR